MLAHNRVLRISVPGGRVEAERSLAPSAGGRSSEDPRLSVPGTLLAAGPDGETVAALVRRPPGGRDAVAVINAKTLEPRCRYPLERGVRYRGLRLGASGMLYAFGHRQAGDPKRSAAVLTTVDTAAREVIESQTVRPPNADWFVHWGALSPDEHHLALSYHGSSTTGADWLELSDSTVERCRSGNPGNVCVDEVHGAVEPFGDGFLAATGTDVLEVDWDGEVVRRLRVRARFVHLMNFALEVDRALLYVSSCGKRPAIHRLDLTAGGGLRALPSGRFCGEPFAVQGDRFLVLAAARVDKAGSPGPTEGLRLLDLDHPGAGKRVSGSAAPQDALFVAPRG